MFDVGERNGCVGGCNMSSSRVREETKRIRLKLTINLFKRYVLGKTHVAGQPQVEEMQSSVTGSRLFELIDARTWINWFDPSSPIPKRKTVRALDQIAQAGIGIVYSTRDAEYRLAPNFFEELVHGGLLSAMTKAKKSKRTAAVLGDVVSQYQPLSAWHLHLDSIEVSSLSEGLGNLSWTQVKGLASTRLLSVLNALWGPRIGSIYSMFASNLKLEWDAASAEEREDLRSRFAIYPVSFFENEMSQVPCPDWSRIGVDPDLADVHIYKALLATAADFDFLKAERKHAWAFDLASAALAMLALAWTNRYLTFSLWVESEQICWWTFSAMFFALDEVEPEEVQRRFKATAKHLRLPWTKELHEVLLDGRRCYLNEINDLGLDAASVVAVARHATDVHRR